MSHYMGEYTVMSDESVNTHYYTEYSVILIAIDDLSTFNLSTMSHYTEKYTLLAIYATMTLAIYRM